MQTLQSNLRQSASAILHSVEGQGGLLPRLRQRLLEDPSINREQRNNALSYLLGQSHTTLQLFFMVHESTSEEKALHSLLTMSEQFSLLQAINYSSLKEVKVLGQPLVPFMLGQNIQHSMVQAANEFCAEFLAPGLELFAEEMKAPNSASGTGVLRTYEIMARASGLEDATHCGIFYANTIPVAYLQEARQHEERASYFLAEQQGNENQVISFDFNLSIRGNALRLQGGSVLFHLKRMFEAAQLDFERFANSGPVPDIHSLPPENFAFSFSPEKNGSFERHAQVEFKFEGQQLDGNMHLYLPDGKLSVVTRLGRVFDLEKNYEKQ